MLTRSQAAKKQDLVYDDLVQISEEPDFFKEIDFQRKLAIWLKMKMGKSIREISELLNKPKTTIQHDIERWQEYQTVEDLPGRGRKKKIKVQTRRKIEERQIEDRIKTARQIWRELLEEDDGLDDINYHNVNECINEIFVKSYAKRMILLSSQNQLKRVSFVKKILSWRECKRNMIIWSDEKVFEMHPQTGQVILKLRPEENPLDFALPRMQQGGGHIIVWRAISTSGERCF